MMKPARDDMRGGPGGEHLRSRGERTRREQLDRLLAQGRRHPARGAAQDLDDTRFERHQRDLQRARLDRSAVRRTHGTDAGDVGRREGCIDPRRGRRGRCLRGGSAPGRQGARAAENARPAAA